MAISVLELLGRVQTGVRARVRHKDSELTAILVGDAERAALATVPLIVEMDYESITGCRVLHSFEDEDSGLWQGPEDTVVLRGRVHQVLADDDDSVIDLYLMNGPEFFLFRASHAETDTLPVDAGVELVVEGLRFFLPRSSRNRNKRARVVVMVIVLAVVAATGSMMRWGIEPRVQTFGPRVGPPRSLYGEHGPGIPTALLALGAAIAAGVVARKPRRLCSLAVAGLALGGLAYAAWFILRVLPEEGLVPDTGLWVTTAAFALMAVLAWRVRGPGATR